MTFVVGREVDVHRETINAALREVLRGEARRQEIRAFVISSRKARKADLIFPATMVP